MKQLINRLFGKRKESKYLKCYYGVALDKKGEVREFKTMPDGKVFALVCVTIIQVLLIFARFI